MAVAVVIAVFGRYFLHIPLPEAMNLAYFAMLWSAFLQTGKALYKNSHVSMDFIIQYLPYKSRAIAGIIINIIILVTVVPLFWYSTFFTWESFIYGWNFPGSFPLPMFLLYGIMALGSFYLGTITIFKIIEHRKEIKMSD
ncbi:MAG TPA: TRAP transporter small permease [Desulfatiglandales bacterium]|nr:TRAP transporter small permease [Desulfatiglandales bacterium]